MSNHRTLPGSSIPLEEEILCKLSAALNRKYTMGSISKIVINDPSFGESTFAKNDHYFLFSIHAKENLLTLYDNNFFEAYDTKRGKFISKIFSNAEVFYRDDDQPIICDTIRLYFYPDGDATYGMNESPLKPREYIIEFSSFNFGKLTKAVR